MHIVVLRSNDVMLRVRLVLYSVAFVHLLIVGLVLLNVDMSKDNDPNIRVYTVVRWRLLTIWFNIIALLYFPTTIYCDWMEKKGRWDEKHVRMLRKVKDVVFTSILLPTTLYCDSMFWRTWYKDPAIIAPVGIFVYLPYWTHHSLHTVSAVVVLLDLLMIPRRRPDSLLPGAVLMTVFLTLYALIMAVSYANGIVIYAVLNVFSRYQVFLLLLLSYIEFFFYYTVQWLVVDSVWGKRGDKINYKNK